MELWRIFFLATLTMSVRSWAPEDEIIDDEIPASNITKRKAIRNERYRWTDGVIPYRIDKRAFKSDAIELIRVCLDQWSDVTCLTFREKTRGDQNFIQVKADNRGCRSAVGMRGHVQYLYLGRNCVWRTTILHEFGHAIGLHHEHQHPGRDNGITIDLSNAHGKAHKWFTTNSDKYINTYGVKYDIDSIMHYNSKAFTHNSRRTMWATNRLEQARLDNYWKTLSFSDAKIVNIMYKCDSECGDVECPDEGFVDKNCRCVTPQSFFDDHCKDKLDRKTCEKYAFTGSCDKNSRRVIQGCRRTCDRCSMAMLLRKKHGDKTCFNEYYDDAQCDDWTKRGFCKDRRSRKFMSQKCKMSCKMCQTGEKEDKDKEDKKGGEGKGESEETSGNGKGGSTGVTTKELECPDLYTGCAKWAREGKCKPGDTLYKFIRSRCRGSCGYCGVEFPEKRETAGDCEDLDDTCYLLNKNGQCADNSVVRTHCPGTCGLCQP